MIKNTDLLLDMTNFLYTSKFLDFSLQLWYILKKIKVSCTLGLGNTPSVTYQITELFDITNLLYHDLFVLICK